MTADGLHDIIQTLRRPHLVLYMAWSDIRARYKRSVLGPLWITLSTAISVVGLGFIWSELFHMDRSTFVPMLTIGLVLWQFMSSCIMESSAVLVRSGRIVRNLNLPLSLHSAQLVLRQVINLGHNAPLFVIVALILGKSFTVDMLWVVPALLIVIANLFWISLLLGILGARFRDLEYMVNMVMPLLMFMSPVMYRPNSLSITTGKYMWFNPLADMIEIIRHPLLGEPTPAFLYWVNIGMLVVGGGFTLLMFNAKHRRIAFWV